MVSPAVANFLFETANFLLLAAALGWVLFKPVRRALDAEGRRHEEEKREIERLRAEAEKLAEETRLARQAAEHDVEQRRQQILSAAQQRASEIVDKVRKTQRDERAALHEELAVTRKAEAAALADAVGCLAADAVRELLQSLPGPSLDTALVRAACVKLEAMPADARRGAMVEVARALDEEGRTLLRDALGDGFKEHVVAELGAGVRVTTPAGQVDATAVSIARRAGRAVRTANDGSAGRGGEETHHA